MGPEHNAVIAVFGGAGDGAISLDDVLAQDVAATLAVEIMAAATLTAAEPDPAAYAHVAIVTWDVTGAGLTPVARNHAEVVMAGLEPMLEGRFEPKGTIVSSLCLGSVAAIAEHMGKRRAAVAGLVRRGLDRLRVLLLES